MKMDEIFHERWQLGESMQKYTKNVVQRAVKMKMHENNV
jgi:hypothetical protein